MRNFIILLSLTFSFSLVFGQKTIYVSPSGSDSNNGSSGSPFKTVQKALDESKKFTSQKTEVIIKKGTYRPSSTIIIDQSHARSENNPLVLKSEAPQEAIISGGRKITGWTKGADGIYTADAKGLKFRQLYINGKKAIRAKFPDHNGFMNMNVACEAKKPLVSIKGDIPQGMDLSNSDAFIKLRWGGTKIPVGKHLQLEGGDIVKNPGHYLEINNKMAQYAFFTASSICKFWQVRTNGFLENSKKFLNTENEWYLDTIANKVYYMPPTGVDLNTADVEVPALTHILTMDKMTNITVEGVIFEHSDWQLPNGGFFFAAQASMNQTINDSHPRTPAFAEKTDHAPNSWNEHDLMPPSAVELDMCKNIKFHKNVFRFCGGSALSLRRGEKNIDIIGNVIHTTGSNGITGAVAPNYRNDDMPIAENVTISNNYIANIGTEMFSSCGIGFYFCNNLKIEHNEIYALVYQGIHTGWNKDFNIGRLKNVYINFNDIHDFMFMNIDGGGIHNVNFVLEEFIIEGNHIHSPAPMSFRGNKEALGIYLDNCTTNAKVIGNMSEETIGSLNGGEKGKRFHNYWKQNHEKYGAIRPTFEGNHAPGKNKNNRYNVLSEEEQKAIADKAGVTEEYEFMKKFAPKSTIWENYKNGDRYNDPQDKVLGVKGDKKKKKG